MVLLALLATGCGTSTSAAKKQAVAGGAPLVHLPADQAAHSSAGNEWWYVVGHLRSGSRLFGYEMTVFKLNHIRPPHFTTPISLYRTDIAITDVTNHRFHQTVSYYFPTNAHVSTTSLKVKVGTASLTGASPNSMVLRASLPRGAISIRLASQRPAMDVGGRGYIPFGNAFTYYYSLTDLASNGTIRLGKQTYQVTGTSWMDHQWGNWSWSTIRGWTWMAFQLNSGTQLSVFDFRGTHTRVRAASILTPSGATRTIHGISITPTGHWTSPHTGARYPSGWIVRIPRVRAVLRIRPDVLDQELFFPASKAASYWEGSGHITGTYNGKSTSGLSYTELTGFAGTGAP